mgnify:CR=1 FL=1
MACTRHVNVLSAYSIYMVFEKRAYVIFLFSSFSLMMAGRQLCTSFPPLSLGLWAPILSLLVVLR